MRSKRMVIPQNKQGAIYTNGQEMRHEPAQGSHPALQEDIAPFPLTAPALLDSDVNACSSHRRSQGGRGGQGDGDHCLRGTYPFLLIRSPKQLCHSINSLLRVLPSAFHLAAALCIWRLHPPLLSPCPPAGEKPETLPNLLSTRPSRFLIILYSYCY